MDMKKIGAAIAAARKKSGLTQDALAERIGVSSQGRVGDTCPVAFAAPRNMSSVRRKSFIGLFS